MEHANLYFKTPWGKRIMKAFSIPADGKCGLV